MGMKVALAEGAACLQAWGPLAHLGNEQGPAWLVWGMWESGGQARM